MPRVIGIDIPDKKQLIVSLTYIYGVGSKIAAEIIEKLGLNPSMRAQQLTEEDIGQINALLQSQYIVEGDLRRQIQKDRKSVV